VEFSAENKLQDTLKREVEEIKTEVLSHLELLIKASLTETTTAGNKFNLERYL